MIRKVRFGWAAMAVVLLIAGLAATAGENTWVSAEGHHYRIHSGENAFFHEGATELDLADLADGETRVIGVGPKQVTVSRSGDEATVTRPANADDAELSITCRLSTDSCSVLTFDDDPEKVMIVIKKTRECEHGVGDCEMDVVAMDELGEGMNRIVVTKTVECDEDGDCTEAADVTELLHGGHGMFHVKTAGPGSEDVVVIGEHGGGHPVMILEESGKTTLRCPEGDTKMHVDPEEADDVFLCPKHSVPLEKQKSHPIHRIEIKKHGADDDE